MASTLLRDTSFILRVSPENQICLFTIANLRIKKLYSLMVGLEWEAASDEIKIVGLKTWFDSAEQLVDYIKVPEPSRIHVDLQLQVVGIFVRVRKGSDRFAKIGELRLTEKYVTPQISLKWVEQECNQQNLNNSQIASLIQMLSSAYREISSHKKNKLERNRDSYHDLLEMFEYVENMFKLARDNIQREYKQVKKQYQLHKNKQKRMLGLMEALIQQAEGQQKDYFQKIQSGKKPTGSPTQKQNQASPYQASRQMPLDGINTKFEKVLEHIINTDSPYFSHFRIENMWIRLAIPSVKDNTIMLTCRHRVTDIIKYCVKIQKLTKRMGFGIVDLRCRNKVRCSSKDYLIKYNTNGGFFYLKTFHHAGEQLKEGQIITVTADLRKGTIEWRSGSALMYQHSLSILVNPEIFWVPYIELSGKDDAIEWVLDNDYKYE